MGECRDNSTNPVSAAVWELPIFAIRSRPAFHFNDIARRRRAIHLHHIASPYGDHVGFSVRMSRLSQPSTGHTEQPLSIPHEALI